MNIVKNSLYRNEREFFTGAGMYMEIKRVPLVHSNYAASREKISLLNLARTVAYPHPDVLVVVSEFPPKQSNTAAVCRCLL